MQKLMLITLILALSLAFFPQNTTVQAQDNPAYERVTITADDGLELVGLYSGTDGIEDESDLVPAVLLMHHGNASKEKWIEFFPAFHEANYAFLAIDLRGHGETGGRNEQAPNAEKHIADTKLWVDWLRNQEGIDPNRISIVGASTGADVGLNVLADDENLVTLVGFSVALEVEDLTTAPAVAEIEQPIFLVTGFEDALGLEAVQGLIFESQGEMQIRMYDTSLCCTFLLGFQDGLLEATINWLNEYNK